MKIILNSDVHNLGEEGDVRDVARGYARNFLIPRGHAVPYTKANIAVFEHRRAAIEKRKEEKRKAALGLKERLEELTLTIKMPVGDTGKLFGSVNNAVIMDALQKEGISVERKKIDIPEHSIRMVGKYKARIKLYSEEVAIVNVDVVSDKDTPAPAAAATAAAKVTEEKTETDEPVEAEAQESEAEEAVESDAADEDAVVSEDE